MERMRADVADQGQVRVTLAQELQVHARTPVDLVITVHDREKVICNRPQITVAGKEVVLPDGTARLDEPFQIGHHDFAEGLWRIDWSVVRSHVAAAEHNMYA